MQQPNFKNDSKLEECFNSLPTIVQESIMQSGVEIKSVEHLKQLADNFLNKSSNIAKESV